MENSVDPSHLYWLQGETAYLGQEMRQYQEKHEFIMFEYGISKRRITPGKNPGDPPRVDEHPLVFPTTLRHVSPARGVANGRYRHNMQIRVPVDDTHTQVFRVNFVPTDTERSPPDQNPPHEYRPLKDAEGNFYMDLVSGQDSMAWETQGPITDRTQEHLGVGDRGIVLLRKLLKEQIDIVRKGGDPMGTIRDPEKNKMIAFDVVNETIGLFRASAQAQPLRAEATAP
jgi:5,5'-dehydrodivanillate O-demethylase oxygenase subunit